GPAVGSWNFESGTNESWGRGFNSSASTPSVSSAHPRGTSKLALKGPVDAFFGDAADANGLLVVSPCVGDAFSMVGRRVSAWVYFEATVTYSLVTINAFADDVAETGSIPTPSVAITPAMYNQWQQ